MKYFLWQKGFYICFYLLKTWEEFSSQIKLNQPHTLKLQFTFPICAQYNNL